jgi:hypothetical protein
MRIKHASALTRFYLGLHENISDLAEESCDEDDGHRNVENTEPLPAVIIGHHIAVANRGSSRETKVECLNRCPVLN